MRLETPTQLVMSKVNRGNIHTFFYFLCWVEHVQKETEKTTFKPLGKVWLHYILLGIVLQDLGLSISQRQSNTAGPVCASWC